VAYLFDTDAISETFRPRPLPRYAEWMNTLELGAQFTSAVVIGELYKGAFECPHTERILANIESDVLPILTVLPYNESIARIYGEISASLAAAGQMFATSDLQIAATALHHGLTLVTGNLRHFSRIAGLDISRALADARPGNRQDPSR
jgi:predicted nucleic acid-binding protein